MKKSFLIFLAVCLTIYFFYVHGTIVQINNIPIEPYVPSDTEINFISALHTFNGEGLYKSVSNVYPPGRFFTISLFFKILGASIPTAGLYFILIPTLFFPTLLFFIAYKIFRQYASFLFSSALATLATLLYLFFIYSSQDVHVIVALFFIVLLSKFRTQRLKNTILGILLGVVFLFRIEAGVFLLLSTTVAFLRERVNFKSLTPALIGFLGVWVPTLTYLIFTGSLRYFIYDTLYPGLIVQPKLITLPIPHTLEYVFLAILIFLFSVSLSWYINPNSQAGIRIFALFSVLSFSAALVRSDEGHLWYGAVWLSPHASYLLLQLTNFKENMKRMLIPLIVPVSLALFALGYFIIKFKSATFFIIATVFVFWLFTKKFKKDYSFLILISGVITSLIVFHSLVFLRLRFAGLPSLPKVSLKKTLSAEVFLPEADEIHGLKFSKSYIAVLEKVNKRLDHKNKWLFIYPNHVIFYDFFKLKNPTRHYYFAIGSSNEIQEEIIRDLEKTKVRNFIFFPDEETPQEKVRKWILSKTYIEQTYTLGSKKLELRKRKI